MMYHSNVLYDEGRSVSHHITQDDEANVELGKGEVGYNVGVTTVKSLPSPSVLTEATL